MKRRIAATLIMMLTVGLLAGCGGGTTSTPPAQEPATEEAEVPEEEAEADAGETQAAAAGTPVTWKFATNTLEDTEVAKVYQEMASKINEATGGEVTLEIYYGGALGSEADVIQNVQTGNIEMGHYSFAMLAGFEPAWNVLDLPFIFDNREHFARYVATDECQALMKKFEDVGIWFNTMGIQGYRQTNMVKETLKSAEDYKGKTIRVMDNAVQMGTLEALGAIPITVPYGDVYNALNMGVCDGWTAIYTGMNETSSCEVAPYVTEVPMFACVTGITISTKALDSISDEAETAVKDVYAEMMPKILDAMYEEDMGYRTVFEEAGLLKEVYTIDDTAPFIEAVSPVWEKISAENAGVQDQIDIINSVR